VNILTPSKEINMGCKIPVGKGTVQPCPSRLKVQHLSNNRKPAILVKGQQTLHK
jgi:hypothetical protein